MELINFNKEKHLKMINEMLKSYNWEPWDDRAFDNNRHYCVIENDKILYFTGFYVFDNGIYARLGIQLGNREIPKDKRKSAMKLAIDHIFTEAKKIGVTGIEFCTSNEACSNSLIELGMVDNSGSKGSAKILNKEFSNIDYLKEE